MGFKSQLVQIEGFRDWDIGYRYDTWSWRYGLIYNDTEVLKVTYLASWYSWSACLVVL